MKAALLEALEIVSTPTVTREQLIAPAVGSFEIMDRDGDPWLVINRKVRDNSILLSATCPDTGSAKTFVWKDETNRFYRGGVPMDELNHRHTHLRRI